MNDLDLITGLTPQAPLPGPDELSPARDRLTAAISMSESAERSADLPVPSSSRIHQLPDAGARWRRNLGARPTRRLALTAVATAVGVVAAATMLSAVTGHRGQSANRPTAVSPGAQQAPVTINVAAARFLERAAAAVQGQPAQPPGLDQFVYTKTEGSGGTINSQEWLSASGSMSGLVLNPGQPNSPVPPCTTAEAAKAVGANAGKKRPWPNLTCYAETSGYLPDMPTSPQQLLAYLAAVGVANPPNPALGASWYSNDLGKAIDELMSTTYLLPAQQAALFKLMAQTPGFTAVPDAPDAIGQVGEAIEWSYEGAPAEIILNPSTYAYMGDRTWAVSGSNLPGADAYHGSALVQMAFVSKVGQLP